MVRTLPLLFLLCAAPACVFDGTSSADGFLAPDEPTGPDAGAPDGDEPEPAEPDAAEPTDEGDGDGDLEPSCPSHPVQAEKRHRPEAWDDGVLSFDAPRTILLPAELPVVHGNAGDHCASLDLRRGDAQIRCLYRGSSAQSAPSPGSEDWDDGLRYELDRCGEPDGGCRIDDDAELEAGDPIEVDLLTLHIDEGAFRGGAPDPYDPTRVEVVIDEACPGDGGPSDGGGGDGDGGDDDDD